MWFPLIIETRLRSHSKMWGRRFIVRPCVHREVAIVEFRFWYFRRSLVVRICIETCSTTHIHVRRDTMDTNSCYKNNTQNSLVGYESPTILHETISPKILSLKPQFNSYMCPNDLSKQWVINFDQTLIILIIMISVQIICHLQFPLYERGSTA